MSQKIFKGHNIGIMKLQKRHTLVSDGFDYMRFIDVCRVTPPADVEVGCFLK